jgi:DNA-binding PadR family transcriptional regulator
MYHGGHATGDQALHGPDGGLRMLDLAILGLLFEQEMHGYEIRRRLRDELGLFANISFGSLYPALSRLERSGAVAVAASAGAATPMVSTGSLSGERAGLRARRAGGGLGTKRSRKVYRITEEGRTLFEQLLEGEEPAGADDARSFGLRLAFARHLTPSARLALLERRRDQLTRRLATDLARASGERLDVYTRSLVEHSTEATEHDIAWLDRLIEAERLRQSPGRSGGAPAETSDHTDLDDRSGGAVTSTSPSGAS